MATSIPLELQATGWRLEEPPPPLLENFPACRRQVHFPGKPSVTQQRMPGCHWQCMVNDGVAARWNNKMAKHSGGISPMMSNMFTAASRDVNRTQKCAHSRTQSAGGWAPAADVRVSPRARLSLIAVASDASASCARSVRSQPTFGPLLPASPSRRSPHERSHASPLLTTLMTTICHACGRRKSSSRR